MVKEKAVLLINVGTPDKPTVGSVRKFLFQFLNDRKVIDIPLIPQKLLVNLIIVPFRAPKSTKLYQRLWTEEGSPIISHTTDLANELNSTQSDFDFYFAMRYGNPSLKSVLKDIQNKNYKELVVLPMYPQFADSTTGSTIKKTKQLILKLGIHTPIKIVDQFYNHPSYIKAQTDIIKQYDLTEYDHIIFSYHGLPIRHLNKTHPKVNAIGCNCNQALPDHGKYCYQATCYATSRSLAKELKLKPTDYTVTFQSRLSDKWMKPFTDDVMKKLGQEGKKHVLVATPSFVTDCLETIIEIGFEAEEIFKEHGGKHLERVPCLNANKKWANAILGIICEKELGSMFR